MDKHVIAEQNLIGRLGIFTYELSTCLDLGLKEEHFKNEILKDIYKQMVEKFLEKSNFNVNELECDLDYLYELIDNQMIVHIESAIEEVINNFRIRTLDKGLEKVLHSPKKLEEKINDLLTVVNELENTTGAKNEFFDLGDLVDDFFTEEQENIIPFPYKNINDFFTLEKESLITIGALSGLGKTAFALNLAYKTSQERNVLYVNLEMGKKQIRNRIWGLEALVNYFKIERKTANADELERLSFAIGNLKKSKMKILDCQDSNFEKVVEQIKRKHKSFKFDLIIVDYLTLLRPSKNYGNRNNEVEYMANKFKALAKELDTCIIILAQLNRGLEERKDKRPHLNDLRDSGGIGQASNVVAFLHREDYFEAEKGTQTQLEFIIRKNRSGNTGTVYLGYNLEFQKIVEK